MKKWGLSLMLFAILAAPALACGFPLPAGTSMMAVSKAVCAVGEAADSCQVRQDAYQMMGKITSVTVSDMQADLLVDDGTSATEMHITGSFDYQATTSETGLGANVHAVVTDGTITSEGSEQSLSGTEFVVLENTAYTTTDSGANWVYEELDENAMLGLSFLLGLSGTMGTGLDLFSQPSGFIVTAGSDTEIDGQTMHVQTLTLNLEALLADPDAITSMLEESGEAMGEIGVDPSTLGDPAQLAMFAAILLPAFEGSEFFTTLYIGADDGYIHRIEENYVFMMDSSKIAFGTEEGEAPTVITMTYQLSGTLGQFNDSALVIAAPKNAVEGEGLLSEESGLFGGSGLGGSLFGQ